MPKRKVIDGATAKRGLTGSQTTGRRLSQQFGLRGGLNNNSDISAQSPSEWLNCTNARMPILGSSATGAVIGTNLPGSMFTAPTYTVIGASFPNYQMQLSSTSIMALQNTVFPADSTSFSGSGTGSILSSATSTLFGSAESGASFVLANSQNLTLTSTLANAKNLTSVIASQPILAFDAEFSAGTYASGYIRIGSSSSNYYQWAITQNFVATPRFQPIKFNWNTPTSTTGTPNIASIAYVSISFTTGGSDTMSISINNVRLANFSSTSQTNYAIGYLGSNISQAFPYVVSTDSNSTLLMMNINSTLYCNYVTSIGLATSSDYSYSSVPVLSGFTPGGKFQFSQYPKSGSLSKNILYFVNGVDGAFSLDMTGTAVFSQISTAKYTCLCTYSNYMWYAGDPNNPNTIYPSIIANPGAIDTSNAITLDSGNGQSYITGLLSMDTYLIIFRNNDIWIMTGNTTGLITSGGNIAVQKSMSTVGSLNQGCLARIGPLSYFYNGRGVYGFNGSQESLISEKISFTINGVAVSPQSVSLVYNTNEEALYVMCGPSDPNVVNPIPSTSYVNSGSYIYNPNQKNWTFIGGTNDPLSVYIGGFTYNSPINSQNYFYSYGLYFLSQFSATPTLPVNFNQNFLVQSCWNNLASPFIEKDPDQVRLFITASQPQSFGIMNFYTDFVDTPVYSTIFPIPQVGTAPFVDLTIGPGCQGHAFSVEIFVPNEDVGYLIDANGNYLTDNSNNFLAYSSNGAYNQIVYSGYAPTWTEAEVI